ncbi:hypothetical protein NKI36_14295 [Mesorhizobium caraganae]|uniref:NlpC/P60 domain-containing protein n=1 Tax=Mesorhizobium caraganae TaxID=483206 RepID=A0ABV1YZQ8_9HYPH
MRGIHALVISLLINPLPALAQDFNPFILDAVKIVAERKGGGYDINKSFTRNLSYGSGVIEASNPPSTMCVAAVVEVMVEAIKLYSKQHPEIYSKIPLSSWTKGNLTSLRANFYLYEGSKSKGTAHTLERFGIGKQLKFSQLKPGDFINFNRSTDKPSGHSVIFIHYLNSKGERVADFNDSVAGFRYFSAQMAQGGEPAGMGYRNGFFGPCPASIPKPRDCKIIRTDNSYLFNAGRMSDPKDWEYENAVSKVKAGVRAAFEGAYPGESRGFIDKLTALELNRELDPATAQAEMFDGSTPEE